MLGLTMFNDIKIGYQIQKFVNERLAEVVRVFIDIIDDNNDYGIEDFLPLPNLRADFKAWEEKVRELYELIISGSTRNNIKPYYEYLLYYILDWYIKCNDDDYDMVNFSVPEKLQAAIMNAQNMSNDEKHCIIDYISDLKKYGEIIFYDRDFHIDNVANMVMLYINNKTMFNILFEDINLDDYYLLMPGDIQDLYNEAKNNNQSNNMVKRIYDDVMLACKTFLKNNEYANCKKLENVRNDYLRDLLEKDYAPSDQKRQGMSYTNQSAGMVDIVLRNKNSMVAIIEALNLDAIDQTKIAEHIDKVYNYDTIGNNVNFIVMYVEAKKFESFWDKYVKYVSEYKYKYPVIDINLQPHNQYSELKTMSVDLNRNGVLTKLYHIAIHIQLPNKNNE